MHRPASACSCETPVSWRRRRTRVPTTNMRTKLWLGVILSTSALAACGGGSHNADAPPGTPDAPIVPTVDGSPDGRPDADPLLPDADPQFACLGQPIPTTAPTTLTISGDVAELAPGGSTPKSGV